MALPESKHISETLAVMLIQTATEHHKVMLDRELLCHHVKSKAGRALHTGRFHESYRPPWLLSARVRGDRNLSASAEMNLFNHKTKIIWTSALCFHPLNHFAKWSLCPQVQISVDGSTNKNKRVKWKFTYSRQNSLIVIWDQADMQKKCFWSKDTTKQRRTRSNGSWKCYSFILLLEEKKKTVIIGIIYSGGDFCWQNRHCNISCCWLTFGQRWCRNRNTHSAVFMRCSINSKRVHTRLNIQPPVKSTSGPQSQFQRLHTNPQIVIWMKRKGNK